MEYVGHCDSPLGGITLASDGEALTGLWFDGQKHFAAVLDADHEEGEPPVFARTREWLDAYFTGRDPGFVPPVRLKATGFRKAVWEMLLEIPYGTTTTYGDVAEKLARRNGGAKTSARAVGGAVGRNPISLVVPCHRIVGADGSLAGYAGGLWRKAWLLELERVKCQSKCNSGQVKCTVVTEGCF